MTKEEFLRQKAEAEKQICRRVIPLGYIYSVQVAAVFGFVSATVLLVMYFDTELRGRLLLVLGICVLMFWGGFSAERYSKKLFVELMFKCPACQSSLVFLETDEEGQQVLQTGLCYKCKGQVFDL